MTDLNALSAKELVRHFNQLVLASHPMIPQIPGIWKGSKAQLIGKIVELPTTPEVFNKAQCEQNVADEAGVPVEAIRGGGQGAPEVVIADKPTRPAKIVKAPKPTKVEEKDHPGISRVRGLATPKATEEKISKHSGNEFGEYCAANSLNPKVIRARLRKEGLSAPYTITQVKNLMSRPVK